MILFKVYLKRVAGHHRRHYKEEVESIIRLARAKKSGYKNFELARRNIKDPFLKETALLLDWAKGEVKTEQLRELLNVKAETFFTRYQNESQIFEQFSKLPLRLGILGSIILFTDVLFRSETAQTILVECGHSLMPILYGYILTFFILAPISKNLYDSNNEDRIARDIVVDGVMMIHQSFHPKFIEEKILSYLLPSERHLGNPQKKSS